MTNKKAKTKDQKKSKFMPTMFEEFPEKFDVIHKLSNDGTPMSMKKLEEFIEQEENKDVKAYAEIALDEARFFYYSPNTETEEKDFILAKMILKTRRQCYDLEFEIEKMKHKIEKLKIEGQVHEQLLKTASAKKKKDWEFNFLSDFYGMALGELAKLEDDLAYKEAWIKQAEKLIKNKKYLTVPFETLDHTHLDGEEYEPWPKDQEDDDCCECYCPRCGEYCE